MRVNRDMIEQKQLDDNFKRYDYKGLPIYKIHDGGYAVYDGKIQDIIIIQKTLRRIKSDIDAWENAKRRSKDEERVYHDQN